MKRYFLIILISLMSASTAMAVEVTFTPRLTLREEFTDNFYRSPEDKEDEYITTVAPGATLGFRGTTGELNLSYDPTYVTYAETDEESDWRHYGSLDGVWSLSRRTQMNLAGTIVVSEDPADDEETLAITQGRNRYARYTGDMGLTYQFGREDTAGIGFFYSVLENEEDLIEDSQLSRPYVDLTKWFGESRYGITTHFDYSMAEFDLDGDAEPSDDFTSLYGYLRLMRRMNRNLDLFVQYAHTTTDYDGMTEDYSVYNPSIGFTYQIEEQTTVTMALGYFIRDREESEDDSGVSLTGDLASTWSFPRGTIELTADAGYRQESFDDENLGFSYYAGGDGRLNYGFTRNFEGDLFGGYHYERFLDTDPEITDNTATAGAGISYQALSWMSLRLEYRYQTVSSTEDAREYDENRAWFSITFTPESPFRLN